MASIKDYTGYLTKDVTVPAGSTVTVEYQDVQPNYFKVGNNGTTPIYASLRGYPTIKKYDLKIDGASVKVHAEPFSSDRIYIYNPSKESINVTVTTFTAPFDPAVFVLGDLSMEIQGTVNTDGVTKGFECSLPEGNNTIGKVGIDGDVVMRGSQYSGLVNKLNDIYGSVSLLPTYTIGITDIVDNTKSIGKYKLMHQHIGAGETIFISNVMCIDCISAESETTVFIDVYNASDTAHSTSLCRHQLKVSNTPITDILKNSYSGANDYVYGILALNSCDISYTVAQYI